MSYKATLEQQCLRSIPQEGKIEWIGIRPKRMAKVHYVSEVWPIQTRGWKAITSESPQLANDK